MPDAKTALDKAIAAFKTYQETGRQEIATAVAKAKILQEAQRKAAAEAGKK